MEQILQNRFAVLWFSLFVLFLLGFIPLCFTYVHFKQHVCVERYIQRFFRKRFQAHLIRHIHLQKPGYRQCHRLLGLGYFYVTHGYLGLLEKELPETISSDFEFKKPQKINRLLVRIREILPSRRYTVLEDISSKNSLVVSTLYNDEVCHVRIRIIRAQNKPGHYVYRLICTWVA